MTDDATTRVLKALSEDATATFDPSSCADAEPTLAFESPVLGPDGVDTPAPADGQLEAGAPGEGRYELRRIIGRGGFAEVWEATQTALQRTVAVKRLRADVMHDAGTSRLALEGFRSEALTAAALEHPNIVPVYDANEDDRGRLQLALKLVRGTTWRDMILHEVEQPVRELLERHLPILIDVAQAVAFAHSRGIIHRDIKPSQVMVGEFGEVLLFDWGLALPVSDGSLGGRAETSAGAGSAARASVPGAEGSTCPAGTPAFMAPEQTDQTPDRLGPWTDVYLLGGCLYSLLTGTVPRPDMNAAEAFVAAMQQDIEPPSQRAPQRDIPADLEQLTMQALHRDPRQRPSAAEFVTLLQASLSGASQRRQSGELTREIASALPAELGSYAELSQCVADLAHAEGLWRENPEIPGLRERVHEQYATAALHNGDLELARRQAAQLRNDGTRWRLQEAIDLRTAALRRTARQRRVFLTVSVALGVLLVVLAAKYAFDQHRAQRRLEAQRNEAVAARVQAEGLTSFMLEDLTPGLEQIGRLDLLDQVAQSAVEYYASFPSDETDGGTMVRRSLALRDAARVLRDQGHLDESRTAMLASLGIATELAENEPESSEYRQQLADRWLELGELMQRTADPDAAAQAFDQAVGLFESLLEDASAAVDLRRGLARALAGQAYEAWSDARLTEALSLLERSKRLLEGCLRERPNDGVGRRLLLDILTRESHVLRDTGELEAAVDAIREAIELGVVLTQTEPMNMMARASLAECYSALGFALWQKDETDAALDAYQNALRTNRELAGQDPSNQNRQRRLADTLANVGEMQHELGDTANAQASLSEGVAILEQLVLENPEHAEWSYSLAAALLELGRVQADRGAVSTARSAWREAADAMEPIARRRGDLYYLDTYARALLLLGDVETARPVVEELLSKGWSHPEFEQLCRRHGLDSS